MSVPDEMMGSQLGCIGEQMGVLVGSVLDDAIHHVVPIITSTMMPSSFKSASPGHSPRRPWRRIN